MNLTGAELKRLAPALVVLVALVACGTALIWYTERSLKAAAVQLAASKGDRSQNRERLSRISEEEKEVREKLTIYRQLGEAGVLGPERRLEWADSVARIRKERELADVRYRVDPQKTTKSVAGKAGPVDFNVSTMRVNLSLLHEGDLFAFLDDLRGSGNAYYSVQKCALSRTAGAPNPASLAPRVQAECVVDLVTVVDRGAKK